MSKVKKIIYKKIKATLPEPRYYISNTFSEGVRTASKITGVHYQSDYTFHGGGAWLESLVLSDEDLNKLKAEGKERGIEIVEAEDQYTLYKVRG